MPFGEMNPRQPLPTSYRPTSSVSGPAPQKTPPHVKARALARELSSGTVDFDTGIKALGFRTLPAAVLAQLNQANSPDDVRTLMANQQPPLTSISFICQEGSGWSVSTITLDAKNTPVLEQDDKNQVILTSKHLSDLLRARITEVHVVVKTASGKEANTTQPSFRVGDTVKFQLLDEDGDKKTGTIVEANDEFVTIEVSEQRRWTLEQETLNACNFKRISDHPDRASGFGVGDRVTFQAEDGTTKTGVITKMSGVAVEIDVTDKRQWEISHENFDVHHLELVGSRTESRA